MEKQKLPNATAVLVLGILSLVSCCCFGIFGFIFSVIALLLAKKDLKLYQENPQNYTNYSNLKTGRIIAIIGLVLSTLFMLKIGYGIYEVGWDNFIEEIQRGYEEAKRNQQQ